MFKIGDFVSYRSEGVCVVFDIREESFGVMGKNEKYYILAPVNDQNSKLYVPMSNKMLISQMLPLLSEGEIRAMAQELCGQRIEWIEDSRARSTAFKTILSSGDRKSLMLLVNTLRERLEGGDGVRGKCTAGDENVFKRAKKILFDEFSQTVKLETEEDFFALIG